MLQPLARQSKPNEERRAFVLPINAPLGGKSEGFKERQRRKKLFLEKQKIENPCFYVLAYKSLLSLWFLSPGRPTLYTMMQESSTSIDVVFPTIVFKKTSKCSITPQCVVTKPPLPDQNPRSPDPPHATPCHNQSTALSFWRLCENDFRSLNRNSIGVAEQLLLLKQYAPKQYRCKHQN